ncbi:virulence RhuM family protein [uncultured Fibrobacter sp.]|uniref:virulence RhuM family protein n=1 Tax=uncultured Fibrobacter sp. TaxID=261512 RepID=UPI00280436A2|nr:virulence RhuM family protein [uncultured Fibrobacter sp.]
MHNKPQATPPMQFNFLLYKSAQEDVSVNALLKDDTIWLSQKAMAQLFDCSVDNIGLHLKNIYEAEELHPAATTEEISVVQQEGTRLVNRKSTFYNLDAIISVGYRVNSRRATAFRIWATGILREYITKGFVMDDDRLKQGQNAFGKDYFRELLERVRSIRASERRIWQQITDIFAECAIDYDKNAPETHDFYAMVQNKFHYAITGSTAAEIIYNSADRNKENMGLTTWKNAPDGRILKSDVTVAKNYLDEKQIRRLERAVTGFFDYIEDLIENETAFTMEEFAESVNAFLEFRKFKILDGNGKVSKKAADKKAEEEYTEFNRYQKITSDFDKAVKKMLEEGNK